MVQPNPNLPGRLKPVHQHHHQIARMSSAKPKSAWQIETRPQRTRWCGRRCVQPNPNLPGRLKLLRNKYCICSPRSSAKPKSAWQIETVYIRHAIPHRLSSAKPKSAWQIETESDVTPTVVVPVVQPNPNLPGRLKQRGQCLSERLAAAPEFSQTQICLAD